MTFLGRGSDTWSVTRQVMRYQALHLVTIFTAFFSDTSWIRWECFSLQVITCRAVASEAFWLSRPASCMKALRSAQPLLKIAQQTEALSCSSCGRDERMCTVVCLSPGPSALGMSTTYSSTLGRLQKSVFMYRLKKSFPPSVSGPGTCWEGWPLSCMFVSWLNWMCC